MQAWQEQKAKQMAEEEEAAKAAAEEAVKWTFSDDESDEVCCLAFPEVPYEKWCFLLGYGFWLMRLLH